MITKTHFEISASWMKACGFGDSAKIVKVLKIENHGNGREVVTVEHPATASILMGGLSVHGWPWSLC